ncbi:MAG: TIM barrel protein [Pseudomonadota bacterium]
MHNFAANLTMMFNEVQLAARFEQAAKAGFCGVEMLFPYELPAAAVRNTLHEHALTLALFNIEPGNWDVGDRGLAAQKGREDQFEKAVTTALAYADTVGCIRLHAMAGLAATADDETFIGNLSLAARMAEPHGIEILIEPINTYDMPGYHLSQTNHAQSIIEAVGAPNVGLQLDLYHRHRMGADVLAEVVEYADITRHIQIAGPPKRGEPDKGEWNLAEILEAIDRSQYRGWIGCEYRPLGGTQDGLGWLDNVEMQPRNSAA